MAKEKILILNESQILQKIRRMAYQIYESNFQEEVIILAGVNGAGFKLAQMLTEELGRIASFQVILTQVRLDKKLLTQTEVGIDIPSAELKNRSIVLVDDVLNTGRTIAHSLPPFLNSSPKKLEIATLVNRSHKLFPIASDFTGYELSTTLTDHIEVTLEEGQMTAYLK
ncbi:phosphoribosyltransferase [Cytophagales bacterium RKSG123]|nr:phosphoribosyltransferase [Xanthovirga aplysinae]